MEKSQLKSDQFWLNDLNILFQNDRFLEFWISSDMTNIEKLNAILRLSLYLSIILVLYHKNLKYFLLVFLVAIITIFINKYGLAPFNCPEFFEQESHDKITFADYKKFKMPTLNNPFMNSTVYDLQDPEKNKRAIPYLDSSDKSLAVKEDIESKFSYNLYEDYGDVYQTGGSRQRFYTMPAEFTAHDKNRESLNFFYGDLMNRKTNSFKTLNGNYVNYGRMA